jgi:hypothetical protein
MAPTLCSDNDSDLGPPCERMRAVGIALVKRAQEAGEIRADVIASDVIVMANAVAWAAGFASDEPELAERSLSLLMDGLATPAKAATPPSKPLAAARKPTVDRAKRRTA